MKDGVINYLCSSKCRKNMLMKRRKVRWISKSVLKIFLRRINFKLSVILFYIEF